MRRLIVFNQVTIDGYFTGPGGDLQWAHGDSNDAEWNDFVSSNASGGGILVFGRITYDMMKAYWPTPAALRDQPGVATYMNSRQKVVFSRTLDHASWENTTLIKTDPVDAIRTLKQEPGPDMAILGSGSIVSQLAQAGLIDEFQIVVVPTAIGAGRSMFDGGERPLNFTLAKSRTFNNGKVVLWYRPSAD